jgi:hypothetical protein
MKKIQKKLLFPLLKVALSLLVIYSIESCINDCDTSNSTYAIMEFDTAGTAVAIQYVAFGEHGEIIDSIISTSKVNSFALPVDLSKDSTRIVFYISSPKIRPKEDSVPSGNDTILFTYSRNVFQRGPDCGFDVKISDLKIKYYSMTVVDTVLITAPTLTSTFTTNVKVRLKVKP